MSTTVVRYTTRPDRGDENESLVAAVYAELASDRPAGLRYITYRLDDGVTFVHIATVDTPDGSNPLTDVTAFGAFQAGIPERFEQAPTVMNARVVGSYGMDPLA